MHRDEIDVHLARRLVAAQFPQWAALPVSAVSEGGWDNRVFHLGDEMLLRLPSGPGYAAQVEKEQRWLPWLASRLPRPIPTPLAAGEPGQGFPWRWSIYRWLQGETARRSRIPDLDRFAAELAAFLAVLHGLDATGGPAPGAHNFWRGGRLSTYDGEVREALAALEDRIDTGTARAAWEAALQTEWDRPPVWLHGDFARGNLLLGDAGLAAVIDFGCCAVGDPACDLAVSWTLLDRSSRGVLRAALPHDGATWMRGHGWALWKALILFPRRGEPVTEDERDAPRVLDELLADFRAGWVC